MGSYASKLNKKLTASITSKIENVSSCCCAACRALNLASPGNGSPDNENGNEAGHHQKQGVGGCRGSKDPQRCPSTPARATLPFQIIACLSTCVQHSARAFVLVRSRYNCNRGLFMPPPLTVGSMLPKFGSVCQRASFLKLRARA